jgi:hypothetical protein
MIAASTVITPGTPVEFSSPQSKQMVSGLVNSDRGTYAIVEWEEDEARLSSCVHKGELSCPALVDVRMHNPRSDSSATATQMSLFDGLNLDSRIQLTPVKADEEDSAQLTDAVQDGARRGSGYSPEAIAMRLAEVSRGGQHLYYVRDLTYGALDSELATGVDVTDWSHLVRHDG